MEKRKKNSGIFIVTLILIVTLFTASIIKTNMYNKKRHQETYAGSSLFTSEEVNNEVNVRLIPRNSTWEKIFDLNNEGLTESNYQAYTYDIVVSNDTTDQVLDYSMKLTFSNDLFLASAWNGSLEIHQNVNDEETVALIPDLRQFVPSEYDLETFTVDGESFIFLHTGDYFVYTPSATMNAKEMPIEPYETSTPGIILYVAIGENIEESSLEIDYSFHKTLVHEPLFWISMVGSFFWLIAAVFYAVLSIQEKKFNERLERDNEIINESIETFTGFIDAKDQYTNGHSKRVAIYTKMIAEELGYEGEELDRIYYTALLHDCGKSGVPDNILCKPGKLTKEEFEIIKSHTIRGGEILKSFKSLKDVEKGALYHHERYDGHGYPEGLAGEEIPLIARMICVADSFDAMNSNRVYRKKLTKEYILNELEVNKGKQFDPRFADIMLKLIHEGKIKMVD